MFDGPPHALDEDNVASCPFSINALDLAGSQHLDEIGKGELATLVGIEYLRRAVTRQRLLPSLHSEVSLQRDRYAPGKNAAREPTDARPANARCTITIWDQVPRMTQFARPPWDLHLADVGYDGLHDYSAWRWIVSAPVFHAILECFPRISAPVPLGVSAVSYALALSACAPFRTDWADVQASLIEEVQP